MPGSPISRTQTTGRAATQTPVGQPDVALRGSMATCDTPAKKTAERSFVSSAAPAPSAPQQAEEGLTDSMLNFYAGACVSLQCVCVKDCGVTWREIVRACGERELLEYAALIELEEWELAGFQRYAAQELGKSKPRKLSALAAPAALPASNARNAALEEAARLVETTRETITIEAGGDTQRHLTQRKGDGDLTGMTWAAGIRSLMNNPATASAQQDEHEAAAWTTDDDLEPISDALKRANPDLNGKDYTVPLFRVARQVHTNAGMVALTDEQIFEVAALHGWARKGEQGQWIVCHTNAAANLLNLVRALTHLPPASESGDARDTALWIPVSERLPERSRPDATFSDHVLAVDMTREHPTIQMSQCNWIEGFPLVWNGIGDATHWMPLPGTPVIDAAISHEQSQEGVAP